MDRVETVHQARRGRRSSGGRDGAVSVLRWPAGRSGNRVFELFSAREAGRLGSAEPAPAGASYERENVLLVSASRRVGPDAPAVQLSLVNTSPLQAVTLSVKLAGRPPKSLAGTVLTVPAMAGDRAFEPSNVPQPSVFRDAVLKGRTVETTVPARSVVVLTLR
jgi:hypothetical protein